MIGQEISGSMISIRRRKFPPEIANGPGYTLKVRFTVTFCQERKLYVIARIDDNRSNM